MQAVALRLKACLIPAQGDSPGAGVRFEFIAGQRPASSELMNRAFSARPSRLAINPRLSPWAGMSDAVGVEALVPRAFSR